MRLCSQNLGRSTDYCGIRPAEASSADPARFCAGKARRYSITLPQGGNDLLVDKFGIAPRAAVGSSPPEHLEVAEAVRTHQLKDSLDNSQL